MNHPRQPFFAARIHRFSNNMLARSFRPRLLLGIASLLMAMSALRTTRAATIVVNSAADPAGYNAGITIATLGTTVTLRDAVNAANNSGSGNTITFDSALAGGQITLGQVGDTATGSSALGITANINIIGPANGLTLAISNGISMRHFLVKTGGALSLTGVTLTGGGQSGDGGSIYNLGQLATTNVTFTGNGANNPAPGSSIQGRGAAVFNTTPGTYLASLTTFSLNSAQGTGGALYNDNPNASAVMIADSAFLNDYSTGYVIGGNNYRSGGGGGALCNAGFIAITRTELGGCTGNNYGGAIYNDAAGRLCLTNCYFSGNSTVNTSDSRGGGIYSAGTMMISACTFDQNSASGTVSYGGAIATVGAQNSNLIVNSNFRGNSSLYGCCVDANSGSMTILFCTSLDNPSPTRWQNVLPFSQEGGAVFGITNSVLYDSGVYGETSGSIQIQNCVVHHYSDGLPYPVSTGLNFIDGGPGLPLESGFSVGSAAVVAGSPCINAAIPIPGITTDVRGVPRDAWPDIGASEYQAPQFTSSGSTTFAAGLRNSFLFSSGGAPPVILSVSGALPAGVTFDTNGVLSGIPPVAAIGNYSFTVTASNTFSPVSTETFSLNVVDGSDLAAGPSFATSGLGWALNGDSVNGGPTIINNTFTLTDGTGGENRSAWFQYPLYIGAFQAAFTYQDLGGGGADGTAFVIQNSPSGPAAIGAPGGGLGYGGITPSVGVLLNIYNGAAGGPSGLLVATNGLGDGAGYWPSVYQSTAPVALDGGNPVAVTLRYTGGDLQISLTDTVTSATFQTNIPVDIGSFVGTNAAWVGFTGSEGGVLSHQTISNFSYTPLPTVSAQPDQSGALTVTWPAAVYGFTLQANTNLNNPAGWAPVNAPVTQNNGWNQVTVSPSNGTQFFRLAL
jgi:hypothetical protein